MSIVTYGFGSGSITTYGWGSPPPIFFVPEILSAYYGVSSAYDCVNDRSYVVDALAIRNLPDSLNDRSINVVNSRQYSEVLIRDKGVIIERSKGWPSQSGEIC